MKLTWEFLQQSTFASSDMCMILALHLKIYGHCKNIKGNSKLQLNHTSQVHDSISIFRKTSFKQANPTYFCVLSTYTQTWMFLLSSWNYLHLSEHIYCVNNHRHPGYFLLLQLEMWSENILIMYHNHTIILITEQSNFFQQQ